MTQYYIKKDNKILFYEENIELLKNTIQQKPELLNVEIKEVPEGSIIIDFELMTVEEAQEQAAAMERERINGLTCTKRVFALALQEYGITYTQLKELIASNDQAQLEWDLCVELQRSNPLLDLMAVQLGVTSKQLDDIFLFANNEIKTLSGENAENTVNEKEQS